METKQTTDEPDPDALALYLLVSSTIKHPAFSRWDEKLRLWTRGQVSWVVEALRDRYGAVSAVWTDASCLVEVLLSDGARRSFLFQVKSSRQEAVREAALAQVARARETAEEDDDFRREPI